MFCYMHYLDVILKSKRQTCTPLNYYFFKSVQIKVNIVGENFENYKSFLRLSKELGNVQLEALEIFDNTLMITL